MINMRKIAIFLLSFITLYFSSCALSKPKPVYDNVSIWKYQPFTEKTKAAKLKTKSTLKLENDLPILDRATALYPLYASFVQAVYPKGEYPPNSRVNENYASADGQHAVFSSKTPEA